MQHFEVRKKFLEFFRKRGHAIIPSSSLVPENDPSVLFTTAGMQPLVPYLLGQAHPEGKRLANLQKCVRTGDIDDIGDNTHATFFEMMGNWSLGDYFKKEAIEWSFELLTSKTEGFGLDPQRLYVTCFEGDENAPRDEESSGIWKEIFEKNSVTGERIYFMPANKNWWSPGDNGPCGPDTEMFYDLTGTLTSGMTKDEYKKADDEQKVVEIWNDVFMEYEKKDGKVVGKLKNKNVDTGSGFERVCAVLQGKNNIFDTDVFRDLMAVSKILAGNTKSQRIIADHMRTAVFMVSDGVTPGNTDQGYILRRLIRRAVFNTDSRSLSRIKVTECVDALICTYEDVYKNLKLKRDTIIDEITLEAERFAKTLEQAISEEKKQVVRNGNQLTGDIAHILLTSHGLPLDIAIEIGNREKYVISKDIHSVFASQMKKHQELSRTGAEKKFKGGLGDTSEMSVKYHTATHLLHQALRDVLGKHVEQKGSNITPERLRFDFVHPQKMTDEEKKKVEEIVNQKIEAKLPVHKVVLPKEEAEKTGALHFFGEKYGDQVTVHYVGDSIENAYSKEYCGGPHVENTGTLGTFKIQKEEAVSAGVRRIKAVLV
ncbi:MAG: hypothetical protein RJA61_655 [Candidatus Parcubacteria bacterium]|jgi:alanyl-tRNA synthetase